METPEELREALLEARREVASLRQERGHAALLLDSIGSLLTSNLERDPFLVLFQALGRAFRFSATLVLAEEDGQAPALRCIAGQPEGQVEALQGRTLPIGRFLRRVLDGRVSASLDGVAIAEWHRQLAGLPSPDRPALFIPMHVRERRGLIVLFREAGQRGFDRGDIALARSFSLLASAAFAALYTRQREMESRRLRQLAERLQRSEKALEHRAYFDQLTGLPNRETVVERVEQAIAGLPPGHGLALAFIDLDDFKKINDFHTHAIGDGLLIAAAARLQQAVRSRDVVGRISGDEFVLLLSSPGDRRQITLIIDRILDHLRQPFRIEGLELHVSASIGISTYPEHGRDYESLRRNADLAMYRAKRNAKGSACFFDASLGDATDARMRLEQKLRIAANRGEFRCAFQPKVDSDRGVVIGFEALARWVDGAGQVHAPGSFLAVATEMGLLNQITNAVLDEILSAFDRLDARYGGATTVSMNIAARQASDSRFMHRLIETIVQAGRPGRIMLEITEEAMVQPEPFRSEILPRLRRAGIGISIDDFGTGYSSFAALADITADELKVDRSFITAIQERPRSQSILKAMESMAAALGMSMVAEGVETAEELAYLRQRTGIRVMQGYLFARPVLLDALLAAPCPVDAPCPASTADPAGRRRAV